jgi:hypothetical protein
MLFILLTTLLQLSRTPPPPVNWLRLDTCDVFAAQPREVKSVYWDSNQHTEVCMTLIPTPESKESLPLRMTLSFTHVGRQLKGPPAVVMLHVSLPPFAVPTWPSLNLLIDREERLDLTTGSPSYSVTYPGGCGTDCSYTGVAVPLTLATFSRIGTAKSVSGEAFGVKFSLSAEDLESLIPFAARLMPPAQQP